MKIGSLFSGIGGLELGLEWAGLGKTVWQVEQKAFCRDILAKHWPEVKRFEDVREVGKHNLEPVDLICGGFPCQDISSAGKGAGLAGERSGLWREFHRVVAELQPEWVVVENVTSGAKRWIDPVVSALGQTGYEVLPVPMSAQAVGAPHRRSRIFLVAHSVSKPLRQQPWWGRRSSGESETQFRLLGEEGFATDTYDESEPTEPVHEQMANVQTAAGHGGWGWGPPVSPVCGVDDGVPNRVDRLRALGNAVVPQCAEVVGHVIKILMGQ